MFKQIFYVPCQWGLKNCSFASVNNNINILLMLFSTCTSNIPKGLIFLDLTKKSTISEPSHITLLLVFSMTRRKVLRFLHKNLSTRNRQIPYRWQECVLNCSCPLWTSRNRSEVSSKVVLLFKCWVAKGTKFELSSEELLI